MVTKDENDLVAQLASTSALASRGTHMRPAEQMRLVAERLADEVRAGEHEGRRRSWRKVTTLLAMFGASRLTNLYREQISAALRDADLVCEPPFETIDRSHTVRLSMRQPTSMEPNKYVPPEQALPRFTAGELSVWSPETKPTAGHRLDPSASNEALLIEVNPNAEPTETLFAALSVHCGEALSLAMVEDLLKADAVPKVSVHDQGLRMLSTFGVRASDDLAEDDVDEVGDTSTAGKLIFQPVEMIIGPNWLVVCWHNSQHLLPSGEQSEGSPILRDQVMGRVKRAWVAAPHRSPDDLAMLITLELARSFEHAEALVAAWQEQWEVKFARNLDAETQSLIVIRRHLAEYRTRLHGLKVTTSPGQKRFKELSIPDAEREIDELAERSLARLGHVSQQVKSGIDSVNMTQLAKQQAQAASEQAQSRRFQDRITWLGAVLLGPGLVAAIFGANVSFPGRDHALGTILMVIVMLLVIALALTLFKQVKDQPQKTASGDHQTGRDGMGD